MPANGPVTRKRETRYRLGNRRLVENSNGSITTLLNAEWTPQMAGKQVTVSEGHPISSLSKRGLGDIGGDFFTERSYVKGLDSPKAFHLSTTLFPFPGKFRTTTYDGPIYPVDPTTVLFPPAGGSSDTLLNAAGTTAIARCKPTNSVADASVFLGELMREGIPSLLGIHSWKDRTDLGRKAGDDYLNYQFGWRPLVSDIRKFANAVQHANTVLTQYERDAGNVVRRQYRFPTKRSKNETLIGTNKVCSGPANTDFYHPTITGNLIRTRETVQHQWFSGAFTYHLPSGNDYRSAMIRNVLEAKKLFGLSLTPDTLWNLAPWSWAIDWFSNAGDVVSNLTDWATDGLVMRYGYVMEHSIVSDTYTISDSGLRDRGVRVPPLTLVTETKIRRRANPFGFGVTWSGLSPFQASIVAALGLTRRG